MEHLPNWNARKLREAAVPLKGKPLRDTVAYLNSLIARDRIPLTVMGHAFFNAAVNYTIAHSKS